MATKNRHGLKTTPYGREGASMTTKHDIKTVRLFLGEIDNASLRGKHRRDLLLKARAAFDRLTLGADVTVQPAGLGVAALIPVGDLVHVGRGSMEEVSA